jgi:hypothetical protein
VNEIEALFSKAGQCLFLTQRIESMFKFIFPFVSDDIDPKPSLDFKEVFTSRKDFIQNKTLGCVINLLKDKEFGYCQNVSDMMTQFISMRNQLVHHMFSPTHFSFSEKDVDEANILLDTYIKLTKSIESLFEPVLLLLFNTIISYNHDNQNLLELKPLIDSKISQYNFSEINNQCGNIDVFFEEIAKSRCATDGRYVDKREVWEETSIIKAIYKSIEECGADDDGWVLLSLCASKIPSYTNLTKNHYGYHKLSELIKVSELFDLSYDKDQNGAETQLKIRKRLNTAR